MKKLPKIVFPAYMEKSDFTMFINEVPEGGFSWEVFDFNPAKSKNPKLKNKKYTKFWVSCYDTQKLMQQMANTIIKLKKIIKGKTA